MPYGADLAFSWLQPTRIVFGDGAAKDAALELKRLGVFRAAIVTDRVLRERTDVVARIEALLGGAGRLAGIVDGVRPDSPAEAIDACAAEAERLGADGLISLGGGSAIDTTKGMAIVLTEGGSIRDHQGSQRLTRRLTPHLALPTTAGTGSEVSGYAVVLDERTHEKMHFADDRLIPDAAILDPSLTLGMPRALTAATALDALTHAIEALQSVQRQPIADALALQAVRLIGLHLPRVLEDGADRVARGQLLLAANLAGQAFNGAGVGLVHAMAHVVGARHGVHHGTANAICIPHVMRWNSDELAAEQAPLAAALGVAAPGLSDGDLAARAADRVAALVAASGLPTRLRDAGVPEGDLESLAEAALSDGAIVYNGKLAADRELVLAVFRAAF